MSNFKDFYENNKKELVISSSGLARAINSNILFGLSKNKEKEFANKISKIAYSDEVLTELSDEIGTIQEEETEEQFVNRAKSSLRKILKDKLSQ